MSDGSGGFGSQIPGMVAHYRFALYGPEELWTMVEPADGSAPADLGVLLTSASKTINEIGEDLKKHSSAVEWEGEGGDAFRGWIRKAALATLGLGDYSETAGKWMANAADTLHEVRPQLERLKESGATARSVLDAHDAKGADGGPSKSDVTSAQKQYDNDRAAAAMLMTKLAQSYSASTQQIGGLEAPEFPAMPKRFVPQVKDGESDRSDGEPARVGEAGAVSGVGALAVGAAALREAARSSDLAASGGSGSVSTPRVNPELPVGGTGTGTGTSLDRAAALHAPTPPTAPSAAAQPHLPTGVSGPNGPVAGAPQMFTGAGRTGVPSSGTRGQLGKPLVSGPQGGSRPGVIGRGVPGVTGTGVPGVPGGAANQAPARGQAAGRPANGISGGRALPPQTGRAAGSVPRGTVVGGGQPQQAQASPARRAPAGRPTMPSHPDGVAGGRPRQNQPKSDRIGPGAGPSAAARKDGARSDREKKKDRQSPQRLSDDEQA